MQSGIAAQSELLALVPPSPLRNISVKRQWDFSSLYIEETDVDEASVRPAEVLEILEMICGFGETSCVFQIILYSSFVFSAHLIFGGTDEDSSSSPWQIFLAGFLDCVAEQVKNEQISPNFNVISKHSNIDAFLVSPSDIRKWDRGVECTELKDFGLLCHLLHAENSNQHLVLDYVNFIEHTVVDFRRRESTTLHKFYRMNGVLSNWKNRAVQIVKPLGSARLAFSLTQLRNLRKDVKSDIYFVVGTNSQQAKSNPRRYKETDILLDDIWYIGPDTEEIYIVLYTKDKNVNSKPLAQTRMSIATIKQKGREKEWIGLGDFVDVHFEYCYAECLQSQSLSMRDLL